MSERKQTARQYAQERGWSQYDGKPCKRCGGTLRSAANGGCTRCHGYKSPLSEEERAVKLQGQIARDVAIKAGISRFQGAPCKTCGGHERYTSTGGCVVCVSRKAQEFQKAQRARFHSETSAILWLNELPAPEFAALYAMCPEIPIGWRAVYSDLGVPGLRTFTGSDVFARPEALVHLANEYQRGTLSEHHESARRLSPAIVAAMKQYNTAIMGRYRNNFR